MHAIEALIFHHFVFGYLTFVPHNLCTPNGNMRDAIPIMLFIRFDFVIPFIFFNFTDSPYSF